MLNYYNILKNNRVDINTIKGERSSSFNKLIKRAPKNPSKEIRNVYDFILLFARHIINWGSYYFTGGSHLHDWWHVYYIEKDVDYICVNDKSFMGYYKNPLEIKSTIGTLGIAIMDVLFDQFKADDILTLIYMVDPYESSKKLEEIVEELLLSNNNEYFGCYLPSCIRHNPIEKLTKPIKIHKFKIQTNLGSRPLINYLDYGNDDYAPLILESMTDKRIKVTSDNNSWLFSLNKEQLMENLDNLQERSELLISNLKLKLSSRIKTTKQSIRDNNNQINEAIKNIENFDKYKRILWKEC